MSHFRTNNTQNQSKKKEQVYINVYDLHPINNLVYYLGVGAFHSGVEVYGTEYSFGGHEFTFSGVFEIEPKTANGVIFRESILIGETSLSSKQVQNLVDKLSDDYMGCSYHPLQRNCNSFTKELIKKLLDKDIPDYINRLAQIGNYFSCLLPYSLTQMKTPSGSITNETTSLTSNGNSSNSSNNNNNNININNKNSSNNNTIGNSKGTFNNNTTSSSLGLPINSTNYSSFPGSGYSLSNSSNSILSSLSPPSSPGSGNSPRDEEKRNKLLMAANKRMFEQQLEEEEDEDEDEDEKITENAALLNNNPQTDISDIITTTLNHTDIDDKGVVEDETNEEQSSTTSSNSSILEETN